MRNLAIASLFTALVAVSACGRTTEQQAATGGLAGLAVAGIPGAAIGAVGGVVAGDAVN